MINKRQLKKMDKKRRINKMDKRISYAKEQRLRFFEFLLDKYGFVKTTTLMTFFDISHSTAQRDITAYKELQPENADYNPSSKTYYKTESFDSKWS